MVFAILVVIILLTGKILFPNWFHETNYNFIIIPFLATTFYGQFIQTNKYRIYTYSTMLLLLRSLPLSHKRIIWTLIFDLVLDLAGTSIMFVGFLYCFSAPVQYYFYLSLLMGLILVMLVSQLCLCFIDKPTINSDSIVLSGSILMIVLLSIYMYFTISLIQSYIFCLALLVFGFYISTKYLSAVINTSNYAYRIKPSHEMALQEECLGDVA
jgi:membrane-associated HD superfamily phosphohydrolase